MGQTPDQGQILNVVTRGHLRGLQCRSEMKFQSMTPSKYIQNEYVRAENKRSSASLTRARIKSILNFQPLYCLSQLC